MFAQLVEKTRQQWLHRNKPSKAPEPDLDDYPIVTSDVVRFADTDQNGHVSNAVFAVLCQNARMDLLNDPTRIEIPPGHLLPIVKLHIEFLAELHWPGTVEIGTRFDHVGRSSIGLDQVIFDARRCVAKARSTIVLIDKETRRPAPLPPKMIKQIRFLFSEDSETATRKTGFAWFISNDRGGDK
jgi:acyl-CoA thioester hydrolase